MLKTLTGRKEPQAPSLQTINSLEDEIGELAHHPSQRLQASQNMERAKQLLTAGLTAAYEDGAAALEAAVKDAEDKTRMLEERRIEQGKALDDLRRAAAEQIMHYTGRAQELTAEVEANIEHLRAMTKWIEEQRNTLKPAAALPPPATEEP